MKSLTILFFKRDQKTEKNFIVLYYTITDQSL